MSIEFKIDGLKNFWAIGTADPEVVDAAKEAAEKNNMSVADYISMLVKEDTKGK